MDLHGLTVQDAYNEFKSAVDDCRSKGIKKLHVITGIGEIKRELPFWCETNPKVKSYIIKEGQGSFLVKIQ